MPPVPTWSVKSKGKMNNRGIFRQCIFASLAESSPIGNLRTTTKFTTTTSVDRERTGTRTSVSAGKRKLKMQSIGRSTTTTLNVNKQVEVVEL